MVEPFGKYRRAVLREEVVDVDMGQAVFLDLTTVPNAIGTEGLRGCSAVLIATKSAAILGHVNPTQTKVVMKQIRDLYTENKATHFQADVHVWVVTPAVLGGQPSPAGSSFPPPPELQAAVEERKQEIFTELGMFGLRPTGTASYSFHYLSNGASPEFEDKGTIQINARTGRTVVYVENRVLYYF